MAPKPIDFLAGPVLDDLFQAVEGAAADKEDVCGVDMDEFLLGMLASALRGNGCDSTFQNFKKRLLHALAGYVAGDRHILALAGYFVYFVKIDDAALRCFEVVIGCLDELEQNILDILANIAGFRQRGRVRDGERHVQDARQGLGQQGLAAAGRSDQEDIALGQLNLFLGVLGRLTLFLARLGPFGRFSAKTRCI